MTFISVRGWQINMC